MSGSRSRRRRKRASSAKRTADKPNAARQGSDPARRRVAPVAAASALRDARDADPAALRSEIRTLRRALATAEEKANEADAKRSRAVARATASLRRENESLEAQLTLLVQEIGQIKHLIDRVPKLEADVRSKERQLAERSQSWQSERATLLAEIERLRAAGSASVAGARSVRAAAAAAAAAAPQHERAR